MPKPRIGIPRVRLRRLERFSAVVARISGQVSGASGVLEFTEAPPDLCELLATTLQRLAEIRMQALELLWRALAKLGEREKDGSNARVLAGQARVAGELFRAVRLLH